MYQNEVVAGFELDLLQVSLSLSYTHLVSIHYSVNYMT
jgi:hypothetical protein